MDVTRLDALYAMGTSQVTLCRAHIRRQLALIRMLRAKGLETDCALHLLLLLRGTLAGARAYLLTIEQLRRVTIEFESRNLVWGPMPSCAKASGTLIVSGPATAKCNDRADIVATATLQAAEL